MVRSVENAVMRKASEQGNSLIEVIIAIAVFFVGVLSVTNLVFSNLNTVDRDTDETLRTMLAREGIELARMTRDSNWLAGNTFYAGMANGSDYSCVPKWDPGVDATPIFDCTPQTLADVGATVILLSSGVGAGAYANQIGGLGGTTTPYQRLIIMHPICDDKTIKDDGQPCFGSVIGIRVESQVQSTRKNITKQTVLFADLYDWK